MIILPSLEIVPAKYSGSTLLSQIPIDGTGDFTVSRTTSPVTGLSTRVNSLGQIELVADNTPRLDYLQPDGTVGCPALLVEPSAANYLVRSQEFDNASWGKSVFGINTSIGTNGIEANVAISPDGTQNADRVNFILQNDPDLGLNQNYGAATSTQTYNTSIWFKGEGTNIGKQIKVQIKRASGGTFVGTTATITLTSGWVRFASSAITLGASNIGVFLSVSSNDATNALIWGAQLEQGSVPTSYIPTTTAAVTRSAEIISRTSASALIGQTEGTIYAEVVLSRVNIGPMIVISDGGDTNRIQISFLTSTQLLATIRVAGVNENYTVTIPTIPATGGVYKMALGYKANDYCFALNGTTYANASSRGVPACNKVGLGTSATESSFLNDRIRAAALYPTRLTDTQLSLLTSPYTSYSSMASALSYTLG